MLGNICVVRRCRRKVEKGSMLDGHKKLFVDVCRDFSTTLGLAETDNELECYLRVILRATPENQSLRISQ